ncbi:MAG: endolytic transglycosylase MltG, partial [Thermodesulfovibrionales bacterium]|nr:endolytic transglycosylase MltG [Thermodesulfovibrionales bacterium]
MEETPSRDTDAETEKSTLIRDATLTGGSFMAFLVLYILMQLFLPFAHMKDPVRFEVTPGTTFRGVTDTLIEKDLVRDPNLFIAMGRLSGLHRRVIPGEYFFLGRVSPWNVFRTVREGHVKLWDVTLLEGGTLGRIGERLARDDLVLPEDFDRLRADPLFLNTLGIHAPTLEGYLFPDTYRFARGLSARKVLAMMVRRTRVVLTPEIMAKAAAVGLDENGLLTLASIIEKEARVDNERAVISAVYHNRLNKGMRLQA